MVLLSRGQPLKSSSRQRLSQSHAPTPYPSISVSLHLHILIVSASHANYRCLNDVRHLSKHGFTSALNHYESMTSQFPVSCWVLTEWCRTHSVVSVIKHVFLVVLSSRPQILFLFFTRCDSPVIRV